MITENTKQVSRDAFMFELIHRCAENPSANASVIRDEVLATQFKAVSIVIPPYLLEQIERARIVYNETPDNIVLTALDDWFAQRKDALKG